MGQKPKKMINRQVAKGAKKTRRKTKFKISKKVETAQFGRSARLLVLPVPASAPRWLPSGAPH